MYCSRNVLQRIRTLCCVGNFSWVFSRCGLLFRVRGQVDGRIYRIGSTTTTQVNRGVVLLAVSWNLEYRKINKMVWFAYVWGGTTLFVGVGVNQFKCALRGCRSHKDKLSLLISQECTYNRCKCQVVQVSWMQVLLLLCCLFSQWLCVWYSLLCRTSSAWRCFFAIDQPRSSCRRIVGWKIQEKARIYHRIGITQTN